MSIFCEPRERKWANTDDTETHSGKKESVTKPWPCLNRRIERFMLSVERFRGRRL